MSAQDYIRVYLDNLLVLAKDSFEDHLEKLEVVVARLLQAYLSINAGKVSSVQI